MENIDKIPPIKNFLEPPNNLTILRKPLCDFFGLCGGCKMQHIPRSNQLAIKQNILTDMFQQQNIKLNHIMPAITENEWHCRHRARLSVKYDIKKDRVLVGFREAKNSRFVSNIDYCKILLKDVSNIIPFLKTTIYSLSIKQKIPQIEVVSGDNSTVLVFRVLEQPSKSDIDKLIIFSEKYNFNIYLQPSNELSMYPLTPDNNESLYYTVPKYKVKIKFKPYHFTQINFKANKKMIEQAINLLECKKTDNILDLFCGIGNFSIPLATQSKSVIGIELSENMILQAKQNALENNIYNALFIPLDLQKDNFHYSIKQKIDKVLIDPPRTGASTILPSILSMKPKYILYISCNPNTLASDAKIIVEKGYYLDKYGIIDMFPQTKHIESIALFKHNESK